MAAGCATPRPVPAIQTPCSRLAAEALEAVYRVGWAVGGGRKRSLRMWVAARGPDRLRLEFAGRLGGTLLSVALDGGELTAVSPRSGEHLRVKAHPGLLESVTGWPVEAEEVSGLLLGCPRPRPRAFEVRYDDWREEAGARVPGRVIVERLGETRGTLQLLLESLSVGPLDAAVFALEPPPGSRAVAPAAPGTPAPLWDFSGGDP